MLDRRIEEQNYNFFISVFMYIFIDITHFFGNFQDRRRVYSILETEGIEIPRYAVLDRDSPDPKSITHSLLSKC